MFNASYFNIKPGYFEGVCNDTDQVHFFFLQSDFFDFYLKICRGQFLQEDFYGQVLFGIGRDNGNTMMYTSIYAGSWDEIILDIGLQFKDPTKHVYTSGPLISTSVDPAVAAEYQVMLYQGNFLNLEGVSFNPTESTDVNSSFPYLSAGTNVGSGQNVFSYYRNYAVLRGLIFR